MIVDGKNFEFDINDPIFKLSQPVVIEESLQNKKAQCVVCEKDSDE